MRFCNRNVGKRTSDVSLSCRKYFRVWEHSTLVSALQSLGAPPQIVRGSKDQCITALRFGAAHSPSNDRP
jgi:hypothetical protein